MAQEVEVNQSFSLMPSSGSTLQTMSSVEIAELTGKRHDHVMRDIKVMLDELQVPAPTFGGSYVGANRKHLPCFNLPRRECLILVSGYSVELRAKIIDRWEALERASRQPTIDPMRALNDPAAMRGLLLTYTEKVIELEAANAELAPKAHALDRIATAEGSLCITDAAKALQMRPKDLFSYLKEHGWIYRRTGADHYVGYQSKTTAGLLEHKITTVLRADGSEKVTEQVRITPKGLTKLSALIQPFSLAA